MDSKILNENYIVHIVHVFKKRMRRAYNNYESNLK